MTSPALNETPLETCWTRIGVHGDRSCEHLTQHVHCHNCDVYASAARTVTHRELPGGYQREWAEHYARKPVVERATDQAALVFRVGREWLALPARLCVTISELATPHRLPHRSDGVLNGIVNVRGSLHPCMSLTALLGIAMEESVHQSGRKAYPRLLVMQLGRQIYALPVQDLYGVHRHALNDLRALPTTAAGSANRLLTGLLVVGEMHVGCLDPDLLGHQLESALK